ncbi:hypothetical protein BCR33DRAFT_569199 [Rhizoclosmatium globosum]|uniref:Uncharacterized protein n=1 Tax=Rhizoclosmatium globosum TaxID=329046 RepID=A0A1Y2B7M0_9FUNG|nr:hypothetical protein BCR33DRAFT_569199 [Rhizoclosmatium globosum]|eukprot:ORY30095.1 hypothetical protein BCR33DRAFT_569199 [Rhizoclosmatium globosum]
MNKQKGGFQKKRGKDLSVNFYESESESYQSETESRGRSESSVSYSASESFSESSQPSAASSAESLECDCLHGPTRIQNRWISERLREYEAKKIDEEQSYRSESESEASSRIDKKPTGNQKHKVTESEVDSVIHSEQASTNPVTSGASTPKASEIRKAQDEDKHAKQAMSVFKSIQRFQAVNPGSGEIILPSNTPPQKGELASEELVLDFIHGYRTRDVSNNAFYLSEDTVVFPAGSVGVVMDIKRRSQKFFHGRHKQEIATLSVHPSKRLVVTGDTVSSGDGTYVYIWDPKAPEDVQRQVQIRVGDKRLARGVADVCFTACGKFAIAVAMDDLHTVHIYNWQKAGKLLTKETGHTNTIFGICVNLNTSTTEFVTFGVNILRSGNLTQSMQN